MDSAEEKYYLVHPAEAYSLEKNKEYLTPGLKQALRRPGEIRFAETSSISLGRQSKARGRVR